MIHYVFTFIQWELIGINSINMCSLMWVIHWYEIGVNLSYGSFVLFEIYVKKWWFFSVYQKTLNLSDLKPKLISKCNENNINLFEIELCIHWDDLRPLDPLNEWERLRGGIVLCEANCIIKYGHCSIRLRVSVLYVRAEHYRHDLHCQKAIEVPRETSGSTYGLHWSNHAFNKVNRIGLS